MSIPKPFEQRFQQLGSFGSALEQGLQAQRLQRISRSLVSRNPGEVLAHTGSSQGFIEANILLIESLSKLRLLAALFACALPPLDEFKHEDAPHDFCPYAVFDLVHWTASTSKTREAPSRSF